jgi:CxxC motif-containing protein (DUF1111 family)
MLTRTVTGSCRSLLDGRRQLGGFSRFENVWSSASSFSQRQGGRYLERLARDAPTSTQRFQRVQHDRRCGKCSNHIRRRLKEPGVFMTRQLQPQSTPSENREDRPRIIYNRTNITFYTGQAMGETSHLRLAQIGLIQTY